MARADLHTALAVDRDIYRASLVDASLLDPVVRLDGGIPGTVRPFTVVREYQGPQGLYIENFEIRDPAGRVLYTSPYRRIELRGEAFEDRFAHDVGALEVSDARPHRVTFFVDDEEVDSVPMFLETSSGGDARVATEETFKKALQKGEIMWVTVPATPGGRGARRPPRDHTQPVWFVWDRKSETVYLINGKGEQNVPGLADHDMVEISTRSKDDRSLIARVPAKVEVVPLDDERWESIGKAAITARLNLPDGDHALERWRRDCSLIHLVPQFGADEDGGEPAPARSAVAAAAPGAGAAAPSQAPAGGQAAAREEEPHVEAQVDQEVFERFVAEGQPERVARAKAKAAYVRAERKRLKEEAAAGS